jgi:hypothetical protein
MATKAATAKAMRTPGWSAFADAYDGLDDDGDHDGLHAVEQPRYGGHV